jgi:hypothetical protein
MTECTCILVHVRGLYLDNLEASCMDRQLEVVPFESGEMA